MDKVEGVRTVASISDRTMQNSCEEMRMPSKSHG
jgi:hypothetical protein